MVMPATAVVKTGLTKGSALVPIAAAATPGNLYLLTAGRTCRLKKVMWYNLSGITGRLQIGTGLAGAFVQALPDIDLPANLGGTMVEVDLPALEFTANITAQTNAAGPNNVLLMVEVEEYGA